MMNYLLHGAAIVGQSGGPTSAINATLAGIIKGFFTENSAITKLYGMQHGVKGFLEDKLYDLSEIFADENGNLDNDKLNLLVTTPSAALGSCRFKLPKPDDSPVFYEEIIEKFKKYDIRYFFYIGGNDSMDTVAKLTEYLRRSDYEMRVIGVPKTIDNDLACTAHTPGYGSAAKFIATTMQEIVRDCSAYATDAVTIVEIMGRDAGWLTAAAALPNLINGLGPDNVYLPEVTFSIDRFFDDVKIALEKHPNVVMAVSEGIRFSDGSYVGEGSQSGAVDEFGHKYLSGTAKELEIAVKKKFGCKVRSIELNLPQRCAAHLASKTDLDESLEVGYNAVKAAINGQTGCMISIVRAPGDYEIKYEPQDISKIANIVRSVPLEFIVEDGNNVTNECLEYIKPLIAGEVAVTYKDGLPVHFVFD